MPFHLKANCHFDDYYNVVIEDDGRVAYAYLMEGEDAIGDVWLYNIQEAPTDSNWDKQQLPYLNPEEYLNKEVRVSPIKDKSEVYFEWNESLNDGSIEVNIYIRDKFIAQIITGSKPGWSTLVVKDGPLAQVY
ncbi:MAG: hypothetical protein EOP47_18315 [Sphingobacteriaceae bacterium]|nr:MAG: hypothetical protein EOP47_18315 [Sphingobacteriaceae bacterium]